MKKNTPQLSRRAVLSGAVAATGLTACGGTASSTRPTAPSSPFAAQPLSSPLPLEEVHTPALLLDLDAFERNLQRMAAHARDGGVGLRPHAKTHKCPIIAKQQLELGAVGICCAKISEAEVMVDAGIDRILITSPVATAEKVERVVGLAARAPGLAMVVDHEESVAAFDAAAGRAGIVLEVLVALDTGTRRTGIALGPPAVQLTAAVDKAQHLRFGGVQAYAGHVMHISGHAARAEASRQALARCLETRALIEQAGFDVPVFSAGGTGTFDIDSGIEGITDLQVGSYCFMDVQYRAIGDRDSDVFDHFEPSLFVLSTAISQPVDDRITVDAGYKAFANEPQAKPEFVDLEGLIYHYGGDEHGIIQFTSEARPLQRGDKTRLLVSHCDPTVNLYDVLYPYRDGVVTELWPIGARGRSQ